TAAQGLTVLGLAWGPDGTLYAGTDGQGVYRLAAGSEPAAISPAGGELAQGAVRGLAIAGGRLFAATPGAVFHTDDGGQTWQKSLPTPARIASLVATDADTLYIGTETMGVYKSGDAG